jgi:hypothetical protein
VEPVPLVPKLKTVVVCVAPDAPKILKRKSVYIIANIVSLTSK